MFTTTILTMVKDTLHGLDLFAREIKYSYFVVEPKMVLYEWKTEVKERPNTGIVLMF